MTTLDLADERDAMAERAKLSWDSAEELCRLLAEKYPDTDPLDLPDDELLRLVQALPGFAGEPRPKSPTTLDVVRGIWTEFYEGQI